MWYIFPRQELIWHPADRYPIYRLAPGALVISVRNCLPQPAGRIARYLAAGAATRLPPQRSPPREHSSPCPARSAPPHAGQEHAAVVVADFGLAAVDRTRTARRPHAHAQQRVRLRPLRLRPELDAQPRSTDGASLQALAARREFGAQKRSRRPRPRCRGRRTRAA